MILLGMWGRNYSASGELAAFPKNAWLWYADNIDDWAPWVDGLQAPPASLTASGSAANGDGYGVFCYRDLDGTYWGMKVDLVRLRQVTRARKKKLYGDFPWREMDGENGGPGVFDYKGKFAGSTTPGWFQCFNQPGETIPPFVDQDDIFSIDGDEPDGRPRSLQNSNPKDVVIEDTIDILAGWVKDIEYDGGRIDEGKALNLAALARILATQPALDFYAEVMDGYPPDLLYWALGTAMHSVPCALEDYAFYWHLQQACNNFTASLLNLDGFWGLFAARPDLAVLFWGNPDVTPSRGVDGGISEQIVFNLSSAAAITLCLPARIVIVDAQSYWPASDTFPNCYGLKDIIDNICWFSRTFAIGGWEVRWLDDDVVAYTRDGDGGQYGWSGGCMIVVNFNTYIERTIDPQSIWPEGQWVHDYSLKGGCTKRDFTVGPGGKPTVTMRANAHSQGTSFALLAPGGVS